MKKKILYTVGVLVLVGFIVYFGLPVYDKIAQEIIRERIIKAGLNPDDYDLRGVAPWNVREYVTNKEIEKAGLNPDDYKIKGTPTASEVRMQVIQQEIAKQLGEYDLTINDIDLSGVDLLSLSTEEIQKLITKKIVEKLTP